jgi:serine protease Do
MPSVVNIATETVIQYNEPYDEMLRQFFGWSRAPVRQQKSISLGSGVIIDEAGYVLTNLHVVRRGDRIQVKLWDGREYEAELRGKTEATDLALVKLKTKPGEKFKAIKLAPDDDLLLGETVLALGNPYGLGGSVTKGILSSKNRRPSRGDEPLDMEDWLQTDAAINPGNSGGPLVNLRGELIGLNVAVYREEDGQRGVGVGFSIPVKQVSGALSHFFAPEETDSLWFGARFKLEDRGTLVVSSVQSGSPAAKAGLCSGARVLEINGKPVRNLIECNHLLVNGAQHQARLLVETAGEERTISVELLSFEELVRHKLGLTLLEITPQTAQRLGVRPGQALYIEAVEKEGPGDRAQLQRGYLVVAIQGQRLQNLNSVAEVLAARNSGDPVQLTVIVPQRLGSSFLEFQQVAVELEVR